MMRFLMQFFLIMILAILLDFILPWWESPLLRFIGGLAIQSRVSFLAGFLGIGLLWFGYAYWRDLHAAVSLGDQLATLFPVNKVALMALGALLGGLVGGFAALTGALLRPSSKKGANPYRI